MQTIACFLLIFLGFFWGIMGFRAMTGKDQLELIKLFAYSMICVMLTVIVLTAVVVIF